MNPSTCDTRPKGRRSKTAGLPPGREVYRSTLAGNLLGQGGGTLWKRTVTFSTSTSQLGSRW